MMDQRKLAIYSRKSKDTGKGESIESQIDMCKNYLHAVFPKVLDSEMLIYEDEGYSGSSTNRPQFQKMLKACKNREINRIVCYKLDRISRSVSDFIKLTEELEKLKIEFVSITDNYETHTATGRAMLSMTMVFAQLERETIAERIRDNMLFLAKDGRWLGGNPPTGYKSVDTISNIKMDGRVKRARMLEIIENEAQIVKQIFEKFLELKSLTKVETYFIQHDIQTKKKNPFSRFAIKGILQNPVYLIADENAWNYFIAENVEIFSEKDAFDGIHGMMVYNKTSQKTGKPNAVNEMTQWIVAVGKHEGIIGGSEWVTVQKMLNQNKSKSYRKPKSNVALFSGLLFCGSCGSFMRPKLTQRRNQDGELIFNYLCELKEKSRSQKCQMKRPNGNELDRLVCQRIRQLSENSSDFIKLLKQGLKSISYNDDAYQETLKNLRKAKRDNENKINNLVSSLSETEAKEARTYVLQEMDVLAKKVQALETQIQEYLCLAESHNTSEEDFQILTEALSTVAGSMDTMTVEQKRMAFRNIIKKIVWDGENVHIYFFGTPEDEIDLSDAEEAEPQRRGCK